ncbi:MAG: tetratricopeptide repeat protein [Patescibacteria group bacterium]
MELAIKGFQKIRPYGNVGDGGNDGYIPETGVYYQVYAPLRAEEKDAEAAEKFKDNFNNLKKTWDQISKINAYNFVFNDKYVGLTIPLEEAGAELSKNNPGVKFEVFTPKNLEEVFFTLTIEQIASLGFDVDSRNALGIARDYLGKLEDELNRGNTGFVLRAVDNIKNVLASQNDESIALDYEILEAKALMRSEKVDEAREKFLSIFKRYPTDARAPLFLAEIYLNDEDPEKNEEWLNEAEKIDKTYWFLKLEQLIRTLRTGTQIETPVINENEFPTDPRIRADFYRIYSLFFERIGDQAKADTFIEKAIHLNPEKLSGYDVRLSYLERQVARSADTENQISSIEAFEKELESVRQKFKSWGGLGLRSNAFLNIKQIHVYLYTANFRAAPELASETFDALLQCYFDFPIDRTIADLVRPIELPQGDFSKLQDYLANAKKRPSSDLLKVIILQFVQKDSLFTEGKAFFERIKAEKILQFINDLEKKEYEKILPFILEDLPFAVAFSTASKAFPELRKKIIEGLPSDGSIQKEKLLLLVNSDEGQIDQAFEILKSFDLSKLSYVECIPTLDVAEKKEAWDFMVVLLEKLLQYEKDERAILQAKLKLFTANFHLERFPEVIRIGASILENQMEAKLLDDANKEILLGQVVYALSKRGDYPGAQEFVEKHISLINSFQAKIGIQAETYLKNKDPQKALEAVVEGIKILKRPSPEEYGSLFLIFSEIGNLMDFPLTPDAAVVDGSFVKMKNEERWFLIGDGDELDALKIPDALKGNFIGKKVGDKVVLENKYSSERKEKEVENILPLEKYILWQSVHQAQRLTIEGLWDKMQAIEVPTTETGIDTKYLIAILEEQNKRGQEFFETYCKNNVPIALLAIVEGGLPQAIGRISNEERGFIKANAGTLQEMEAQKEVAKEIISGTPFYLDGTSALFLSETGLLEKIYKHIPNLKVPQSVISLLLELGEKFRDFPGQAGFMRYAKGKIQFSQPDSSKREMIQKNFENSIKILETESKGTEVISQANKSKEFSEEKVPPSLADACILAQRDEVPILTEDFLYLQVNVHETKKKIPKYCSTLALVRVLYEQGKITFEEYLNFFSYLSSYRVRFLPIAVEDLEKAVLGDGALKQVRVEELRKFNFPLTLSEEYGVEPRIAARLVGHFLIKMLIDDSILPEIVEKVFAEIIPTFPTKQPRKIFARTMLIACVQAINQNKGALIIGSRAQEKIDRLSQFVQVYDPGGIILP